MNCSHGLCRLRLTPTKNVNELWLLKSALLSMGGGMGCHLCIAQVGFERVWDAFRTLHKVKQICAAADHSASLVRIADQLGDSPFGVVHRRLAPAFSIVVLWVIRRHSSASRNFSAMRRLLPFSTDNILSLRAQHIGTKGEVRHFDDSPSGLSDPQALITQANGEVVVAVNPNVALAVSKVRNFTRMYLPEFHRSKVEEDPQEVIDEVYMVLMIMGARPVEKVKLLLINLRVLFKFCSTNGKKRGRRSSRLGKVYGCIP
ncbi:hypothetical protein MTR67_038966 [Solanum verrucosum]|uniref:Uncharacterized protein n=1 Tax=Solanum verrucosum TaxID=315347 RepID=A0AAF0UHE9_SOLVR|nr:hypothetical protein MTR67_038966 [Solanum verrucosum]